MTSAESEVDVTKLSWEEVMEKHRQNASRGAAKSRPKKATKAGRSSPSGTRAQSNAVQADHVSQARAQHGAALSLLSFCSPDVPFDPQKMTDQPLALEALARTLPALRYASDADTWLLRGTHVWENAGKDYAATAVAELVALMPYGDPKADKASEAGRQAARQTLFSKQSSATNIANKMRALARSRRCLSRVELSQLDSEPWLLWAGGLPYDLRKSRFGPVRADVDPGTPHLHTAAVPPAVGLTPLWDSFLAAVWPDPDVRSWAVRALSVALTGYPDAVLPILLGEGGRGKTSVVDLLMSVLGTYAEPVSPKLLSGNEGHASVVYALKGLRLAFIDEGPRNGNVATETLKALTGGTKLTGNRMRENPITFRPTHTLILTANSEPTLTDEALRRRVRLIPCNGDKAAVEAARRAIGDTDGPAWRSEAPGVLAHMMKEAAAWLADRSSASTAAAPAGVRDLAEEIARDQDPVIQWVEDETEPYAHGTKAGDLYAAFISWTRDRGIKHPPSSTAWGRRLNDLGHPGRKSGGTRTRPLRTRPLGVLPLAGDRRLHALPDPA